MGYYPFGNPGFYSLTSAAFVKDRRNKQWIYTQKLGGKIFNWLWYEAKVSYGNHSNYITQNGFLTYNTVNPVWLVAGANLKLYYKHLEIIPAYLFNQQQGSILHYTTETQSGIINYIYFYHLLTATLKWNF